MQIHGQNRCKISVAVVYLLASTESNEPKYPTEKQIRNHREYHVVGWFDLSMLHGVGLCYNYCLLSTIAVGWMT